MNFCLNHTLLRLIKSGFIANSASPIMNKIPRYRFWLMEFRLKSLYASTHLPLTPRLWRLIRESKREAFRYPQDLQALRSLPGFDLIARKFV